jgi:hypothetical protein
MEIVRQVRRFATRTLEPFCFEGLTSRILLCVFLVINGIVLLNGLLHDPTVGYDAKDHISYIRTLILGRLPSPEDSNEFFAAPLPYALPLLLRLIGVSRFGIILKFAQLLNVLYSVVLTYYVIRICRRIRPGDVSFPIWSLLLLGMLTVYYKTMAFVRGEPLAACLVVIAIHQTLVVFTSDDPRSGQVVGLGVILGLLILAKQWGWFVFIAIGLLMIDMALRRTGHRAQVLGTAFLVFLIALTVGGWFYVYLEQRFGSPMAFNIPQAPGFSLANRPREFYLGSGFSQLFTDPVRESFSQSTELFLPIFYSDVWGDYWCYWVVYGQDRRSGESISGKSIINSLGQEYLATNRNTVGPYLGFVNLVSAIPTGVYAAGVLLGMLSLSRHMTRRRNDGQRRTALALITGAVVVSLVGYLVLLIRYPLLGVKGSYMLQVFPLAAILAGDVLCELRDHAPRAYVGVQIVLALSAAHNAPLFFTRYVWR